MPFSPYDQYLGGIRPKRLPACLDRIPALEDVAVSIRDDRPLILTGTVGTGKTTLMAEVDFWTEARNSRRELDARRFPKIPSPPAFRYNLWTAAAEYCEDVKAGFGNARSCERDALGARRLFLDDLGVERDTPQNADALITLIAGRHVRELPTWLTTNLSLDELRARYTERVFSRLFEKALLVELSGSDRRMLSA